MTGPPGLPGAKGEAGPPGKSLPGEPVSTSPFTNTSLETHHLTIGMFPISDHKKKKYPSYCLDQRSNVFGNLMQAKGSLLKKMLLYSLVHIQFWKIHRPPQIFGNLWNLVRYTSFK